MPGPPPNPNARRRNDKAAWRTLPHECSRPAPKWPLPGKPRAGQADLWRHLWALPVAEVWHEQNAVRLIARYALLVLEAERFPADTKLAAECRQIEDRLLISPLPRLKARVLVADKPTGDPATDGTVTNLDDWRDLDVG